MNYRHAGRDQVDASGEVDPSTGGAVLYLTPRLIVSLGGGVVLRLGSADPRRGRHLYGVQSENTNYNAGLTFLF